MKTTLFYILLSATCLMANAALATINIFDDDSYKEAISPANVPTQSVHLTLSEDFLSAYIDTREKNSLLGREPFKMPETRSTVCSKISAAYPAIHTLELQENSYYYPTNSNVFETYFKMDPPHDVNLRDHYPLLPFLDSTRLLLTSLTIYNGMITTIEFIMLIKEKAPNLKHLTVLSPVVAERPYAGTEKQFEVCWHILKDQLSSLKWPYAFVNHATVASICSFLKNTTTFTKLNLKGSPMDESHKNVLREAIQNKVVFLKL